MVRMNAMPMAAKAEAADGMAVEAGKAQVVVNVAGSVQLQ
jgi:predicted secreted protein